MVVHLEPGLHAARRCAGLPEGAYWLAGGCGALILLGSLLAHELTHAILARRAGVTVFDVTLWLFGGVTRLGGEARASALLTRGAVTCGDGLG